MSKHQIRIRSESETKEDVLKAIIRQSENEGDSFMALDLDDIVHKVKRWGLLLPRVKLFYAMKCNPEPAIIKTLVNLGCGFDCATKKEIRLVLDAGADSSRVIFAHPVKGPSHLHYAAKVDVELLTFDNLDELYSIKQYHPSAKLVLRIRCDDKDAKFSLGNKFGALLEEVPNLLETAKILNLDMVGVSFHVGSLSKRPSAYAEGIAAARGVFDKAVVLGFRPYLLDIGGGFNGAKNNNFKEISEVVNHHLDLHFPEDGQVKIIAEPGRYVVDTSIAVAAQITSRRKREDPRGQREVMEYYINDGKYGSFNDLVGYSTPIPLIHGAKGQEEVLTTIFGQTCCGFDVVFEATPFPIMQVGEWLMWEDMGAYSLALSREFNGFAPAKVIVMMSKEFEDSNLLD